MYDYTVGIVLHARRALNFGFVLSATSKGLLALGPQGQVHELGRATDFGFAHSAASKGSWIRVHEVGSTSWGGLPVPELYRNDIQNLYRKAVYRKAFSSDTMDAFVQAMDCKRCMDAASYFLRRDASPFARALLVGLLV